jgi:hypothetical protein
MLKCSLQFRHFLQLATMLLTLVIDALRFLGLCVRPSPRLAAENLFLRKPLVELQTLIRHMASDNPTWGQERIANELLLKLGLQVSPRTVCK